MRTSKPSHPNTYTHVYAYTHACILAPGNKSRSGGPAHGNLVVAVFYSDVFKQLISVGVDETVRWEGVRGGARGGKGLVYREFHPFFSIFNFCFHIPCMQVVGFIHREK